MSAIIGMNTLFGLQKICKQSSVQSHAISPLCDGPQQSGLTARTTSPLNRSLVNYSLLSYSIILIFAILAQQTAAIFPSQRAPSHYLDTTDASSEIIPRLSTADPGRPDESPFLNRDGYRERIQERQAQESTSPFPKPFDGGLGNNFTSPSCSLFFNDFLNDPKFQACYPISLLLVVSLPSLQ